MNIVSKNCRALLRGVKHACDFLLHKAFFSHIIPCIFLLLSEFLCGGFLYGAQENRSKDALAAFKNFDSSGSARTPLRSDALKLPLALHGCVNDVKNGTCNTSRTLSRSRKKSTIVKRRKKRLYRIKRRRVRRFSTAACLKSLPRDKAEKFARLKMAAGLMWPIRRSEFWISSPFGYRKMINGCHGFHAGIDMAAIRGTPVRAAASGRVIKIDSSNVGYGNMVLISHNYHMTTRYAHLHRIKVKSGQYVKKGDIIGLVGNTGNVRHRKGRDGSHLHFEVYIGEKRFNPLFFVS